MGSKDDTIICPLCERETPREYWHKHHLIPKQKGGSKKGTVLCCQACGAQVHMLFTNKELAKKYNTVETLLAHPLMQKYVAWIKKKPNDFKICTKTKKRR